MVPQESGWLPGSNRIVAELAYSSQLDNDKVIITGIPVSLEIARETRTQLEIRAELGLADRFITILALEATAPIN